MSMAAYISTPASFLNLDLELDSRFDLASMATAFGTAVFSLYCGPTPTGFRLCVEPVIDGLLNADSVACTEHLLNVIETLPPEAMASWRSCASRTFDYGFNGGLEEKPLQTDISASHLARMAALGIRLRTTVYPYRQDEPGDTDAASVSG